VDFAQKIELRSDEAKSRQIRSTDNQKCSCPPGTIYCLFVWVRLCTVLPESLFLIFWDFGVILLYISALSRIILWRTLAKLTIAYVDLCRSLNTDSSCKKTPTTKQVLKNQSISQNWTFCIRVLRRVYAAEAPRLRHFGLGTVRCTRAIPSMLFNAINSTWDDQSVQLQSGRADAALQLLLLLLLLMSLWRRALLTTQLVIVDR